MRHGPRVAGLALAALACATWATAQNPVGQEFKVNTVTTGKQIVPRIAMDVFGRFTIVWQDGDLGRIALQRFKADGQPEGGESTVAPGAINQGPDISSNASGNMAVVWSDSGGDGHGFGVLSKRVSSSGGMGQPFRLNTFTSGNQYEPAVAVAPDGSALVSWATADNNYGIDARVISAGGLPAGLQEHTISTGPDMLRNPTVAHLPVVPPGATHRYVIAWSKTGVPVTAIKARLVDANGAPVGAEFQVSSEASPHNQQYPAVASDASGNFVVVWGEVFPFLIKFRRFNSAGTPLGLDFTVPASGRPLSHAHVDMTEQGDFLIVWYDDLIPFDVWAMRFNAAGTPIGGEFRLNSYTTNFQQFPAVALAGTGDFVATWESLGQDGDQDGVYARRFVDLRPAALAVDGNVVNGVWDRGETAVVTPSWRNFTALTQTPTGTLSSLVCPAGFSCAIQDNSASYSIPAGQTAPCTTGACYSVNNVVTGSPVVHNDATTLETLSTGETKTWKLHIGDSFTDVPRTNGFYRFVETLLHRGVTGGCTGTTYCPGNNTLRQELPVFLLIAKEGAGYAPPPCVPPNVFADVSHTGPTGPYCPWIEELFTRGVISGCGGSNYCPGNAVTREQMALFVLKTAEPNLSPPACAPPNLFADVPETSLFCPWIEELANRGIVGGCGGGNYCPGNPVKRDQMAVFITLTFGLTIYGP